MRLFHRKWMQQKATIRNLMQGEPAVENLIIVDSLRAGGGHRTPFCMELARNLNEMSKSSVILVHDLYKWHRLKKKIHFQTKRNVDPNDLLEYSDEAKMINGLGFKVIPYRNLIKTYLREKMNFDFLIADGGIENLLIPPKAKRILLLRQGDENAKVGQLLPSGPYRSPIDWHCYPGVLQIKEGEDFSVHISSIKNFKKEELNPLKHSDFITSIGDPLQFLNRVKELGVEVDEVCFLKDHDVNFMGYFQKFWNPMNQIIMSRKDWVKLDKAWAKHPNIFVAEINFKITENAKRKINEFLFK